MLLWHSSKIFNWAHSNTMHQSFKYCSRKRFGEHHWCCFDIHQRSLIRHITILCTNLSNVAVEALWWRDPLDSRMNEFVERLYYLSFVVHVWRRTLVRYALFYHLWCSLIWLEWYMLYYLHTVLLGSHDSSSIRMSLGYVDQWISTIHILGLLHAMQVFQHGLMK